MLPLFPPLHLLSRLQRFGSVVLLESHTACLNSFTHLGHGVHDTLREISTLGQHVLVVDTEELLDVLNRLVAIHRRDQVRWSRAARRLE